jgi:hypothetical protein
MSKYLALIAVVLIVTLILGVQIPLKYSQAVVVFGLVAVVLAPVAIHKLRHPALAAGVLVGLAMFASYPLEKLFRIGDTFQEFLVTAAYGAVLFVIGFGWKRSWR